jgi:hypothetical protein
MSFGEGKRRKARIHPINLRPNLADLLWGSYGPCTTMSTRMRAADTRKAIWIGICRIGVNTCGASMNFEWSPAIAVIQSVCDLDRAHEARHR